MKKLIFILALSLMTFTLMFADSVDIENTDESSRTWKQIGFGTHETGEGITDEDTENTPFGTYYHDGQRQYLFTVNDLNTAGIGAGAVSGIAWEVVQAEAYPLYGFNIEMKHTTATAPLTDFEGGFTNCYNGSHLTSVGWNQFTFSNNFTWNGTSNILVKVCFDNTDYTYNSTVYNHIAAGTNAYFVEDDATGCSDPYEGTSDYRPNTQFNAAGTLTEPTLALIPGIKDFGTIATGDCSSWETFTLRNVGTGTIAVSSVSLTGADAGEFEIQNNPAPCLLPPDATVDVRFCPTSVGEKSAFLTITDGRAVTDYEITGFAYNSEITEFPYYQNFDHVQEYEMPPDWTSYNDTQGNINIYEGSSGHSAPNYAYLANHNTTTGNLMLISPPTALMYTGTRIKFWCQSGGGLQDLIVGTMTDPTDPATFSELEVVSVNGDLQQYAVYFPASRIDTYAVFKHGMDAVYQSFYIDDFVWEESPDCIEPTNLNTSNITNTTANIDWTEYGLSTSWEVEYGYTGFIQGAGTLISATNPQPLTSLDADTDYEWYVRSDCDVEGYSPWAGPQDFTTDVNCDEPTSLQANNITIGSADLWWTDNASATDWEIEYGLSGFTPGTGTTVSVSSIPYSLMDLTVYTSYDWYVSAECPGRAFSSWASGSFTTEPYCDAPSDLDADNILQNSADLTWTDNASATSWEIEYGEFGFIQGTGTVVTSATESYSLSGLTMGTNYNWYVRAECPVPDELFSPWTGPDNFTTMNGDVYQVGYGDYETDDTEETPFGTGYDDGQRQYLFTVNDLNTAGIGAGEITGIQWEVVQDESQTMYGFNIEMKHTTANAPLTGFETGFTNCYSASHTAYSGWNHFNFTSNFDWDGLSNILVKVCFDNDEYTSSSTVYNHIAAGTNAHFVADGATGCSGYYEETSDIRPNTKFVSLGIITEPTLAVLPGNKDFGTLEIGTCSEWETFELRNVGPGTISISSISLTGDDAAEFEILLNPAPCIIPPNETIDVRFCPTSIGEKNAILTITDGREITNVPLTGFAYSQYVTEFPYYQDFDHASYPDLPPDWTFFNDTGVEYTGVQTNDYNAYSDPNCANMYNYTATTGNLMLISPPTTLSSYGTRVTFWSKHSEDPGVTFDLQVGYMTDPTDPLTFTLLETVPVINVYQLNYVEFPPVRIDTYVVFKHGLESNYTSLYIDDFVWEYTPGCLEPTDMDASNITYESADLGWTENSGETIWEIEYGEGGFVQGSGTTISVSTNPYSLTGLTASTQYDWYIRANCPGREYSPWSAVNSFSTALSSNVTQIGFGTTVDQSLPIEPYYAYTYSQVLYFAADFGAIPAAQNINSIFYNYSGEFLGNFCDHWVVYMGTTTNTEITDWISIGNLTQVYNGDVDLELVSGTGWLQIDLDTPFAYDPAADGNLIIAVDENTPSYTEDEDEFLCDQDTRANVSIQYNSDDTNPLPDSPEPGTLSSYYPNTGFLFGSAAPEDSPTGVTITVDETGDEVVISWDYISGLYYTVYSDADPYGSFTNEVASGISSGSYAVSPIPSGPIFYHVTADNVVRRSPVRTNNNVGKRVWKPKKRK